MNVELIKSLKIKIKLYNDQYSQLLSFSQINKKCEDKDIIAFDIIYDNDIVGFAM